MARSLILEHPASVSTCSSIQGAIASKRLCARATGNVCAALFRMFHIPTSRLQPQPHRLYLDLAAYWLRVTPPAELVVLPSLHLFPHAQRHTLRPDPPPQTSWRSGFTPPACTSRSRSFVSATSAPGETKRQCRHTRNSTIVIQRCLLQTESPSTAEFLVCVHTPSANTRGFRS